jgi:hypothetical protein
MDREARRSTDQPPDPQETQERSDAVDAHAKDVVREMSMA